MTTPKTAELLDEIEREINNNCHCGDSDCPYQNSFSIEERALHLVKALREMHSYIRSVQTTREKIADANIVLNKIDQILRGEQ